MKAVRFEQYGDPLSVLSVVDLDDPGAPGPNEVVVRMLAAPIDPADLLLIAGLYGERPSLPHIAGLEGVGRIEAVGEGVTGLSEGTFVVPIPSSTWQERLRLKAQEVMALPEGVDVEQAAMLKVNPPTAELLLTSFVDLQPGAWVAQNAANSAVGRYVVQLAKAHGLRTLNIVRRQSAAEPLEALGADAILVDDGGDAAALTETAARATGGAPVHLGLDAVGGAATNRLAGLLADEAVIANYGVLSGEPCQIGAPHLIFRGLTLRGFWLSAWFKSVEPGQAGDLYHRLATMVAKGELRTEVMARYPVSRVHDAVALAASSGRDGKILLTF